MSQPMQDKFSLYDISCAALVLSPVVVAGTFLALCLIAVCPADAAILEVNSTVDGVSIRGISESYTTIIDGAGTTVELGNANQVANYMYVASNPSGTDPQFNAHRLPLLSFDTSSLPDDATINSATLSLVFNGKGNEVGGTIAVGFTGWNPTTPGTITADDHNQFYRDRYVDTDIPFDDVVTDGSRTNLTLNALGRSNVSLDGYTNIAMLYDWSITDTYGGNAAATEGGLWTYFRSMEYNGGADQAYLTIDYTSEATPTPTPAPTTTPVCAYTNTGGEAIGAIYGIIGGMLGGLIISRRGVT